MSTTAETESAAVVAPPADEAAAEQGRMWRKVVAFEWDQKEFLEATAALQQGDAEGNVSAVIRAAVDEYRANHPVPAVPAQEG